MVPLSPKLQLKDKHYWQFADRLTFDDTDCRLTKRAHMG